MKLSMFLWVTCALVALCSNSLGQTSAFTYQGSLKDGANPANGAYDLQFRLWDITNPIAGPITLEDVQVTNGIFSVNLDFGTNALPGADRYLEIGVRPGVSTGAFTLLAPKQQVASSPYSIQTIRAQIADNATSLGGVAANQFVQTTDPRLSDARQPTAGSTDYVQNGTSQQAASNFNISGTGTANILRAATQFNIGTNRILSNAGTSNLFAGVDAGFANTNGNSNAYFGYNAGRSNTTGSNNSFFGAFSGFSNTTGTGNNFFGLSAGEQNQTGSGNSYFGDYAGWTRRGSFNSIFGSTTIGTGGAPGDYNSFFGHLAGAKATGNFNTFIGMGSGFQTIAGASNTFVGHNAGDVNITGTFNALLGEYANLSASDLTNATAIGTRSLVGQSNSLVLGSINGINNANADTNVGIGTTTPNFRFHVRANGQDGIKIQHTGTGGFPQIRWTDSSDVFKASIGVDTIGVGSMNMFVNGADRLILKSNGVVQVPGPLFINNPNTVIITSPNGSCWGITVSNTGVLSTFPVTPCP